ncbi:hypothetical protein CC78DRAFT_530149 [Lojkania enalia]|uniref:Uncharacterized protein n=1 Tax=Lojkania enalia TaxID=147567 RepID=A0A9P4KJ92_9PLEO|nr:hypothetical protein CC78DRAFT_530149 [Didymosphaeria enalia]
MDFQRRLDPFELNVAPDEELPNYESATAPSYENEDYDRPLYTYSLRQIDRKLQHVVTFGPSTTPSYKIVSHGTFRLFSKKPDLQMIRALSGSLLECAIASIKFDNDGPLPWCPRAHFSHEGSHGTKIYAMESRNFTDWSIEISGITYMWRLEARPISLVLSERTASLVIAHFTYSRWGTMATNGAEIGELTIYRDGLSVDSDGVEKIICGLLVAIAHLRKMGRHYWNDAPVRATSLTRSHLPSHRASFASYSNL